MGRRDTYPLTTRLPQTAQHIHKSRSSFIGSEISAACTTCLLRYDRGTENNRQRSYGAGANTKASLWRFICRLILLTKRQESPPCTQRAKCWAKETVTQPTGDIYLKY